MSRAEPLIAAKAKENQKAGGQSREVGRQKSDKPLDTKKEAAALAGVSHDTFHKGKVALIAARAKENQKAGGQSREVGRQKSDKPLDTKKEAAALAGVSHDTFHKGKVALIAARAKERQKAQGHRGAEGGRGKKKTLPQKSAKGFDTREEAAALAGVSHDTFHKGNLSEI